MPNTNTVAVRFARRDLAACLALADARKAENAQARARILADDGLTALLLASAQRRGESAIDWSGYFSRLGVL